MAANMDTVPHVYPDVNSWDCVARSGNCIAARGRRAISYRHRIDFRERHPRPNDPLAKCDIYIGCRSDRPSI
jgi:hypothetical protein